LAFFLERQFALLIVVLVLSSTAIFTSLLVVKVNLFSGSLAK
jgi:hypothetical protein